MMLPIHSPSHDLGRAQKLLAAGAFVCAIFWNYCGLHCTKVDALDQSRLSLVALTACAVATILCAIIGFWLLQLERAPRSWGFVMGAAIALAAVVVLLALHPVRPSIEFDGKSLATASVALLGLSLVIQSMARARS